MSFATVRQTIETEFTNLWTSTAIAYENVSFDVSGLDEYVKVYIREGQAVQASLGSDGDFVLPGVAIIHIYTPKNTGTARARQLADLISVLFRAKKINSLQFAVPYGNMIPNDTDYYQYNVNCPFYAYFHI